MTSFAQGRVAKLRASCDACNESKVRCSQTKPVCARCEKQSIPCVYGLSRRTHKDAPRVGAAQTARTTDSSISETIPPDRLGADSSGRDRAQSRSSATMTISPNQINRDGHAHPSLQEQADAALLSSIAGLPQSQLYPEDLESSVNHPTDFSLVPDLTDLSADGYGFLRSSFSSPSISYDLCNVRREMEALRCDCIPRIVKELESIPPAGGGEDIPFDAQFARLRRAMHVSDECVRCQCHSQDEMSILMVSVLIGRVMQCLESTLALTRSSLTSTMSISSGSSSGAPSCATTKFSWGELQIEPDEEDQLKQHLWLLQFRKLERVMEQFKRLVRQVKSSASNGNSAHGTACQCIHMWLMQKAEALKTRYQEQDSCREIAELGALH